MTPISQFQAEHPLSPRKFWKKMFGRIFASIFLAAALAIAITAISGFETDSFNLGSYLLSFGISFIVLVLLFAWYIRVYIRTYRYDCGDQFITIKKGVFAPTEIHVQYQKIQDVYVDQDIIDRVMGLYDVHIASATVTSGIEAHIDGVNHATAEKIKHILLGRIMGNPAYGSTAQPTQPAQVSVAQPMQFTSANKISRATYPLSSRWNILAVIRSLGTGLFVALLIAGRISAEDTGVAFGTLFWPIFIVFFIGALIWQFVWKSNYSFECTTDYILMKTGVFNREEKHMPYKVIQNVILNQTFIEKLLGLATVRIENAASSMMPSKQQRKKDNIEIVGQTPIKAQEIVSTLNDVLRSSSAPSSSGL